MHSLWYETKIYSIYKYPYSNSVCVHLYKNKLNEWININGKIFLSLDHFCSPSRINWRQKITIWLNGQYACALTAIRNELSWWSLAQEEKESTEHPRS